MEYKNLIARGVSYRIDPITRVPDDPGSRPSSYNKSALHDAGQRHIMCVCVCLLPHSELLLNESSDLSRSMTQNFVDQDIYEVEEEKQKKQNKMIKGEGKKGSIS